MNLLKNHYILDFIEFYKSVKSKLEIVKDDSYQLEHHIKDYISLNTQDDFLLDSKKVRLYLPINLLHSAKLNENDKDMLVTWISLVELILSGEYKLECRLNSLSRYNSTVERLFSDILPYYCIHSNVFKTIPHLVFNLNYEFILLMFNKQPKLQHLISKLFSYMNIKDSTNNNYVCIPLYLLAPFDSNFTMSKITMINKYEGSPKSLESVDKINITLSDIQQRYDLKYTNEVLVSNNKGQFNILADKYAILNLQNDKLRGLLQGDLYCINPNLAKLNGMKQLSLAMCLKLAGINEKELKKEMTDFHKLNPNIISIGLGGTMSNFFYWLDTFSRYFSLDCPIDKLFCLENDELTFHNLPRIPLNYLSNIRSLANDYKFAFSKKAYMLLNYTNLYKDYNFECKKLEVSNDINEDQTTNNFICELDKLDKTNFKKTFIIGTPDLETRQGLYLAQQDELLHIPVILPGHQNNDLTIFVNPEFKSNEFLVETYGSINLTMFFINMIIMTYEIIKYINRYKEDLSEQLIYNKTLTIDDLKENLKDLKEGWILQ